MEQILYWCGAIVCVAGAIAIIIKIVKWVNEEHDRKQKYDAYQKQIDDLQTDTEAKMQQMMSEQYLLTESMFAVLDGLKQLNCDGEVTTARSKLEKHLNKQAHGGI